MGLTLVPLLADRERLRALWWAADHADRWDRLAQLEQIGRSSDRRRRWAALDEASSWAPAWAWDVSRSLADSSRPGRNQELGRIADLHVQQVTGLDTVTLGRAVDIVPVTPGTWAQRTPDKPALVIAETGRTTTYAELDERSLRLAHVFADAGLVTGDVVAMVSPKSVVLPPYRPSAGTFDAGLWCGFFFLMHRWPLRT